jgi:peptidoglycan/LPS O-acetylase OafA/YrhL
MIVSGSAAPSKLKGLRRITSGGRLIPEIDGFRFLAILVVLIEHIYIQVALPRGVPWPSWLTMPDGGTRGVFLFFTISGFILGLPFARRELLDVPEIAGRQFSYRAYLIRRVTRLEPPYALTLLLRFILILAVFHNDLRELAPHFFASLLYVHNVVFGTMSPISPPTWSLEVEVQFYLLAPLLASVFLIRSAVYRRALLVVVTFSLALASQVYFSADRRIVLSLAGNLQYFSAGLLLCDFFVTRPFRFVPAYVWDCLGIGALIPLLWNESRSTIIFFPFGAVIVYLAGLHGNFVRRFFAAPLVIGSLPVTLQLLVVVGTSLSAVFLIGTAFFLLIERPCMDPLWPRKALSTLRRGYDRRVVS